MKKIILNLLLLLLIPVLAEANYLKVIGGLTSSKNDFVGFKNESKLTLTGGVGIETGALRSRFNAEVLFSYEDVTLDVNGSLNKYRFVKLTMPLLFKYKFQEFNFPYAVIGGAGTIIFADSLAENGKTNALFDFSIVIGVGMEIDLVNKKKLGDENYKWSTLIIEGRYQTGLKNLTLDERKFKTSSLYILFGVKF